MQEACTDDATQIADDLKSIFKHDLVDGTIRETLEQQQHFLYKRLPSSTIPMYKQADECFKAENATVRLQKKINCKKFNQFVEVKANNNKTIFIRKTTALWLLQEGERISTDHLFRVRSK